MRNAIAVMNTKGGVGKSTLVLALAETISAYHGKNVLVIDSDAQASVSSMLMSVSSLYKLQSEGATIVDYLHGRVLKNQVIDWPKFIVRNVSDVDDARSLFLLPSDMQLTLLEREVSKENLHGKLREVIGELLTGVRRVFDIILIDCPPGLSVLTECWLREADFHISPTKADYVSVCGLEVFRRFKGLNPEMGFAENLGVIVNMKETNSVSDEEYHRWLQDNAGERLLRAGHPAHARPAGRRQFPELRAQLSRQVPGPGGHSRARPDRGGHGAARGARRRQGCGQGAGRRQRLRRDSIAAGC